MAAAGRRPAGAARSAGLPRGLNSGPVPASVSPDALSNFSPVMALTFCAGAYYRRGWIWLAPFAAILLSDMYIDRYYAVVYHYEWTAAGAALRFLCFAGALGLGVLVSRRRNWLNLFGGALAGSVLFFLVTNTASW